MTRLPTPSQGDSVRHAGTYELLLDVGRGGMGSIHLARARGEDAGAAGFERLVAIKRAHPFVLDHDGATERFLDEARLAARVHHANVVGIHRVGRDGDGPFLVFDYVEGDTLDALVDYASLRRAPLPPPIVLRIVADALAGLHAAHETSDASGRRLGILHRDVAPQNLLVGVDGVTRLADFGIARESAGALDADKAYLEGRIPFLTPEYLSRGPVDRRIDVYAMGVTAWFALVGHLPWPDATEEDLMRHVVHDGVPPMSSAGLEIAPPVEAIVARACSRDPAKRYATARAMLDDIEGLGRHTGWLASHGEVADLVQSLAGPDLASRRAELASIAARRPDAPLAEKAVVHDAPSGSERWSVERDAAASARARPRARWPEVAGLLAAAVAISVAATQLAGRGRAGSAAPTSTAAATAPSAPSAPSAAPTATARPPDAVEVAEPARADAPRPAPSEARAAATAAAAAPPAPHPSRAKPSSPIATANPYR